MIFEQIQKQLQSYLVRDPRRNHTPRQIDADCSNSRRHLQHAQDQPARLVDSNSPVGAAPDAAEHVVFTPLNVGGWHRFPLFKDDRQG